MEEKEDVQLIVMHEPDEIEAEMPQFISLHTEEWQSKGKPGYFKAWPELDIFNQILAADLARLGMTRLIRITAKKNSIVYEYYYILGNCSYWQVSARISGEEWDHLSLGVTGAIAMIEKIVEQGIKRIEAGQAHYDYKTRLGAKESSMSVLQVTSPQAYSMAKYHILRIVYRIYLIFYFRFYYSRIQAKLPSFFTRPIWKSYIKVIF